MKRTLAARRFLIATLLLPAALAARGGAQAGGTVVDQIAAVVDGEAVTQSEVEDAAWLARFWAPGALDTAPLTAAEYASARGHVIDATVVREAAGREDFDGVADQQVEQQWTALLARPPGAAAQRARLAAAHLDELTVRGLLRTQLTVLAFLDDHVANSVVIGDAEIQTYYDNVFAPQARTAGMTPAPLASVRGQIEGILTQQQLGTAEQEYLRRLKADAKIETLPGAGPGAGLGAGLGAGVGAGVARVAPGGGGA